MDARSKTKWPIVATPFRPRAFDAILPQMASESKTTKSHPSWVSTSIVNGARASVARIINKCGRERLPSASACEMAAAVRIVGG